MAAPQTTSSPAFTWAIRIVAVAPMPEEKSNADSERSRAASFCSTLAIVGFEYREYRYFDDRPSLYATTSSALSNTKVEVS